MLDRWKKMIGGGKKKPTQGEIEEAKLYLNGWVYRISGNYSRDGAVPPEAIVGAWKVDENGKIVGDFINNPNFRKQID